MAASSLARSPRRTQSHAPARTWRTRSSSLKASPTTTTGGKPRSTASASTCFSGSDVASAHAMTISAPGASLSNSASPGARNTAGS